MNEFDQKAAQWDAKPIRVERAHAVVLSGGAEAPRPSGSGPRGRSGGRRPGRVSRRDRRGRASRRGA